jgi:GTP pyrophosphokinase
MGSVKGQLEDLSFPYVYPKEFAWVKSLVGPRYEIMDKEVDQMQADITKQLQQAGIAYDSIHGRRKHLYSLWVKLQRPEYHKDIEKISDLVAVRIIVKSVGDCYAVLGIIHQQWRPVPNRFKDYIAQPKPNGYQSLHTTVFSPSGLPVEVQIRDEQMHQAAEYGVAAHWLYDEAGKPNSGKAVDPRLAWVNQLTAWKQEYENDQQYLEALKVDALQQRIFCFTPKGEVIDLPVAATPVDFAYHLHSDLGHQCVGAKINGKMSALDSELHSGDTVEILTDKNRRGPNADWMNFARTQAARAHIRKALREKPER